MSHIFKQKKKQNKRTHVLLAKINSEAKKSLLQVKLSCDPVCPSVGRSVGLSRSSRKAGKHAFPPLPTRQRLVLAVYPALLIIWSSNLFVLQSKLFTSISWSQATMCRSNGPADRQPGARSRARD